MGPITLGTDNITLSSSSVKGEVLGAKTQSGLLTILCKVHLQSYSTLKGKLLIPEMLCDDISNRFKRLYLQFKEVEGEGLVWKLAK